MKLNVEYFAQVKQAAGVASETVALSDGADIQELIANLVHGHGAEFGKQVLDTSGSIASWILIIINGEQVNPHDCPPLRDGDNIVIMTPMSGG